MVTSDAGYSKFGKTFTKAGKTIAPGRNKMLQNNLTQLGPDGRIMAKYVFNDINLM